jgi:hypothetical protein
VRADSASLPRSLMSSLAGLLRRNWFPISAGLLCFAWAFMAWLTVIPNQDLLADGIQVQSLIHDPRIVLSFPGQKHGGVIEYPFNVLAEWIAPGNYFLESAVRPIFAFLTGFFAARLYLTYFTRAPRWSFLLAVAVGPTVLHGMAGPADNPVGVWWLNANYDLAWLFVILGFWLLGREVTPSPFPSTKTPRVWMFLVSGIVIGLGFYQQPTSIMLIIPMSVLFLLRFPIHLRQLLLLLVGGAIGIIPSILSYILAPVTTWNPSHFPVFQPKLALASLGIDGIPNYVVALLPSALGFGPASTSGAAKLQTLVTALFLASMVICAAAGTIVAIRRQGRVTAGTAIAITWLAVAAGIVFFGIFVDPVWFYSAHLAIILWMSIGLLPQVAPKSRLGVLVTWITITLIAIATVTLNADWYSSMFKRISAKQEYLHGIAADARQAELLGADYAFGSYYDVLPLGYGSGGQIRIVSSTYNRFPLTEESLPARVRVAVNSQPNDDWGRESLAHAYSECAAVASFTSTDSRLILIMDCPSEFLKRDA